MTEMVERVARAICATSCTFTAGKPFEDACPDATCCWDWKACLPEAQAAIAAMREPTQEMLRSGDDFDWASDNVWRTMIDAALK